MTQPVLNRRAALALPPLLALSGCAFFDNLFSDTKKKLPGKREDVLPVNAGLETPHGLHPAVTLPPPAATDWPVAGGVPSHAAGNAALPEGLHQAWTASIGSGSAYRRQVTCTPMVVGDTVFTMDSNATVSAFRAEDGRRLWQVRTRPKKSRTTNVGGGIGVGHGTVYAATGYGEILALAAADGAIRWRKPLATPARSAPTVADGRLFLITIDQELVALSAVDGQQIWSYDGTGTSTTLLGQPSPAYAGGIVVAGFGSGDLVALRGDSGAVAWTDSIAAAATGQVGLGQISAISSQPVIVGEVVLAIGTGGLMVAIDLRAGRRLWEREVSGVQPLIAAADTVFVTTSDQQAAALVAATGQIAWLTQLPQWKRPKSKGAPITWTGPVLAGGALIYGGSRNDMVLVDATSGDLLRTSVMPGPISVPPIAANNTLYIVTDDGTLRAYR